MTWSAYATGRSRAGNRDYKAWRAFGLPIASRGGWTLSWDDNGCAIEVDQGDYGFPTRKLTWLYAVGCSLPDLRTPLPLPLDQRAGCETLWRTERSKTPPVFRDVLLDMARSASRADARGLAPAGRSD